MSNTLDAMRTLSDDRITRFALVTTSSSDTRRLSGWPQTVAKLLDERMAEGEYIGWLVDGRLGVLVCQSLAADAEQLEQRAEWYCECLAEAGGVDTQVHRYPLRPLNGQVSGSDARGTLNSNEPSYGELDRSRTRESSGLNSNEFSYREVRPLYPEGGIEQYFIKPTPAWKRAVDLSLAVAALLALWPLLVLVALLIKCTSRGPILFRQQRTGLGGRPFIMFKFRSMVEGAERLQDQLRHLNEQDGPAFKIRRDPRITPVGRWLRKTCLDELPQLWCVIKGEMSLVGPRPLPCHESAACAGWQRRRLEVVPGLTCLWQIRGRPLVSFDHWMRLDLEYIRRRSLWLDLWIIAATIPALMPGRRTREMGEAAARPTEVVTESP